MPLTKHDAEQLLETLYATAEVLGSEIKPAAASLMVRDLRDYDRAEVEQSLARCRSEITGRLTLAAILERMPSANAFLSANEAWSVVLDSQDEAKTIIWTDEIASGASVARPILDAGDKIGARMAFIGAYDRAVAAAKAEGRKPRWWPSLGDSKDLRAEAIEQGVKDGRLPAPRVEHLLPAPERPATAEEGGDPERVNAMIHKLRTMLDDNNESARQAREEERQREEDRRQWMLAEAENRMAGGRH